MKFIKSNQIILVGIVALSLFISAAFFWDWTPYLRGGWGWRWPHAAPGTIPLDWIGRLAVGSGIYLLGIFLLWHRSTSLFLLWCAVGAIGLPLLAISLYGNPLFELFARTITPIVTGGHYVGTDIENLRSAVISWPEEMPGLYATSGHIATSPPGWPIIYHTLGRMLDAVPAISDPIGLWLRQLQCHNYEMMTRTNGEITSALLGVSSPLWLALTILPLYMLTRDLVSSIAARIAASLWALVPAASIFSGTMTIFYPLLVLTLILCLWRGINEHNSKHQLTYLIGGGILMGLLGILNTSLFPVAFWCGILTLCHWFFVGRSQGDNISKPIRYGLLFGIGLLTVWVPYWLWSGYTPLHLLPIILDLHFDLTYPYLPWVWLHLWDVVIFFGLPIILVSLLGLTGPWSPQLRAWIVSVWLTLLLLDLSGTARGETGRIWMFFMPALIVSAAALLASRSARWRLTVFAVQLLWFLVIIGTIRAVYAPVTRSPDYDQVRVTPLSQPISQLDATFGETLHLIGYQSMVGDEGLLTLDLHWQTLRQPTTTWHIGGLLVNPGGQVVTAIDQQPFDTAYPTTCWLPEKTLMEPVVTRFSFPLPTDAPYGDWWVSLSVFGLDTNNNGLPPLPVRGPDGNDIQVGIGPIHYNLAD